MQFSQIKSQQVHDQQRSKGKNDSHHAADREPFLEKYSRHKGCRPDSYTLEQREQLNLEVASEFIEMASHLIYIKSKMLLPKEELE